MGSLRYLNSVLTILALLLALNVWVSWTTSPLGDNPAHAQSRAVPDAPTGGIPNAAQQRKEISDQLKLVNEQLAKTQALLESGKVRVRVEEAGTTPPVPPRPQPQLFQPQPMPEPEPHPQRPLPPSQPQPQSPTQPQPER